MVTFLVVLLMVYTFRNLLGLLESAIMLQTYVCFHIFRYLVVSLVFSHLGLLEWESFADCAFS